MTFKMGPFQKFKDAFFVFHVHHWQNRRWCSCPSPSPQTLRSCPCFSTSQAAPIGACCSTYSVTGSAQHPPFRTSFYIGLVYVYEWQGGHRAVRSSSGDARTCAVCVWDSLGGGSTRSVFDLLSSTFPTPTRHVYARLPDWTFTYMINGT